MLSQRGQNAKYWNYVGGVVGLRSLVYHQTIFDNNVVLISKKKEIATYYLSKCYQYFCQIMFINVWFWWVGKVIFNVDRGGVKEQLKVMNGN